MRTHLIHELTHWVKIMEIFVKFAASLQITLDFDKRPVSYPPHLGFGVYSVLALGGQGAWKP